MDLLVYSQKEDRSAQKFSAQIDFHKTDRPIETIHSVKQLEHRFRGPRTGQEKRIAVLFAADRQELARLFSIRDLMDGAKIILVLPDYRKEMTSAGHRLLPRYIGYADSSLEDVIAVLKKMMAKPFVNNTDLTAPAYPFGSPAMSDSNSLRFRDN